MADEFCLFTSMRYDAGLIEVRGQGLKRAGWNYENPSPCYMLDYHRDRLLKAATYWQWQAAMDALGGTRGLDALSRIAAEAVGPSQTSPWRLKFLVRQDGHIGCERYSTTPTPLVNLFPERLPPPDSAVAPDTPTRGSEYTLLLDSTDIARSEYTHYKTTKRDMYDAARKRAKVSPADLKEVLVYQANGELMEATITTPYFWRNGRWVTPPVSATFSLDDGSGGQDGTSRRWALERGIAIEESVNIESLVDGEECWISNGVRGYMPARVSLEDGA